MSSAAADRRWRLGAGIAASLLILGFVGGAFMLLATAAAELPGAAALLGDAYLRGVVLFTLEQAVLSTLLSLAGALPLALALHRTRFRGRNLVLRIFLLPQALPVLVGALAIIAVWGRNGVMSDLALLVGGPRLDVYGLPGILIAHVFFNMPLATRLMIAALDAVPAESWKLAGQLSLPPWTSFQVVEWPALRRVLPGAASLIFMLCITSFTLVLTLGGGPGATTLEVAIYQALRYDFDPGRAVVLALAQLALTSLVVMALLLLRGNPTETITLRRPAIRYDCTSRLSRGLDRVAITVGAGFVLAPFAAVLVNGLSADLVRLAGEASVRQAAATSAAIALAAASLSVTLALCLVLAAEAAGAGMKSGGAALRTAALKPFFGLSGSLVLVVPPLVLGAGWFLGLRPFMDVFAAAPLLVVSINALMALPFTTRILAPAVASSAARHDRLAASLGLFGWTRLRLVEWPVLRGPLGLAFAFALALSLGDLGAVALFGNQDLVTFPFLLLQRMGSYRTEDAAGIALLLAVLCLSLMATAERGFAEPRGAA